MTQQTLVKVFKKKIRSHPQRYTLLSFTVDNTRTVLAKKVKEYTAAVNSTQDLLSTVDYNDLETRENPIDTLKKTQNTLEVGCLQQHLRVISCFFLHFQKITKEQRELEVQYKESQSRQCTKAEKRKRVSDTALEPEEAAIAATDLLEDKEITPNVTELFDITVKKERQ